MGGGLIQLVAYGYDNIYLTTDPQITFFKIIYRRHTNFSVEQIPQQFINSADFGKRSTCIISKSADLIGNAMIIVKLPSIKPFTDQKTKFAWIKKIGFGLIKSVEIEINGKVIDKHYGEWLNIWAELTGEINGEHKIGTKYMIGDIPELTDFTSSKDNYTLYIPLKFWFCKNSGSALPIISLQYCDIKINVEFEESINCYLLAPSHYIQCRDDIVSFVQYEYIEQNIDGDIRAGIFIDYDINTKRLYYYKITTKKLISIPVDSSFDTSDYNITNINALLESSTGIKYSIIGKTSGYSTFSEFNYKTMTYANEKLRNINFVDCFLLIDYYFLDEDERYKFAQSKHDYIIEQLFYTPNITINESNYNAKIVVNNPCKFMAWITQMSYINNSGDYFNYTDSYQNKLFVEDITDVQIGSSMGNSLIKTETVMLNGNFRLTSRNNNYFDTIQNYQYTKVTPSTGINMYSFGAFPFMQQPSGTCNMSQINKIDINLKLSSIINTTNPALFRGYCICINILRIVNGLAGLVFV